MESEATAPGGISGSAAATVQSVTRLEQAIRSRTDSDRTFLNWWIYALLLSWITLGIAGIYYFYRRLSRVDAYSRRKSAYYDALIEDTQSGAQRWLAPLGPSGQLPIECERTSGSPRTQA